MINYLYGELNEHVVTAEYAEKDTPTIDMHIDNVTRTISADLKPMTPESFGLGLPPNDGHKYIIVCEYVCPAGCNCCQENKNCCCSKKVPILKWVTLSYPDYAISSDFAINGELVVNSSKDSSCVCGGAIAQ